MGGCKVLKRMAKEAAIRAIREELGVIRKSYTIEALLRSYEGEAIRQKAEAWGETRPIAEVCNLEGYRCKSDQVTEEGEECECEDSEDIRMGANKL